MSLKSGWSLIKNLPSVSPCGCDRLSSEVHIEFIGTDPAICSKALGVISIYFFVGDHDSVPFLSKFSLMYLLSHCFCDKMQFTHKKELKDFIFLVQPLGQKICQKVGMKTIMQKFSFQTKHHFIVTTIRKKGFTLHLNPPLHKTAKLSIPVNACFAKHLLITLNKPSISRSDQIYLFLIVIIGFCHFFLFYNVISSFHNIYIFLIIFI
jgi:hypothetical protein